MKRHFKTLFLVVIIALVTASGFTLPAKAAVNPNITSVTPAQVVNNIDNEVTIHGSDFAGDAQVSFGSTAVTVHSYASDTLIVFIPADFAPGTYSITVTNPTPVPAASFTLSNAFVVNVPPTPPTSTPTPTLAPYGRPQIVVDTYSISVNTIQYNQDFNLNVSLDNAGGSTAYSLQVIFTSSDLLMLKNGGVAAAGDLGVVGKAGVGQTMTAANRLYGLTRVSLDMTVSYSDDKGTAYTDKFTLFLPVAASSSYVSPVTATPTGLQRSQLVITNYETDLVPLQPGYQFTLSIVAQNVGNISAKGVTMIIGGGSTAGSGAGTPQAGGVSGGSGEFTNFAPVGSSNIQSLGDFIPGATVTAKQKLIVNVSANPGAYPMKISFSYTDGKGNQINDDQIITLLVYSLPSVDVGFYQPVEQLVAGQPNALPLQVTSLGKRAAVLGKMKVETTGGIVGNGEALVGSLDPGGYFTLDSTVTPNGPGPLELTITIEYTDDFNQPQTITKTLSLEVMDTPLMPTPDINNPNGGIVIPNAPESVWHKFWRFILGILGLDSSAPSTGPGNNTTPTQIPVQPIKGGGGKG